MKPATTKHSAWNIPSLAALAACMAGLACGAESPVLPDTQESGERPLPEPRTPGNLAWHMFQSRLGNLNEDSLAEIAARREEWEPVLGTWETEGLKTEFFLWLHGMLRSVTRDEELGTCDFRWLQGIVFHELVRRTLSSEEAGNRELRTCVEQNLQAYTRECMIAPVKGQDDRELAFLLEAGSVLAPEATLDNLLDLSRSRLDNVVQAWGAGSSSVAGNLARLPMAADMQQPGTFRLVRRGLFPPGQGQTVQFCRKLLMETLESAGITGTAKTMLWAFDREDCWKDLLPVLKEGLGVDSLFSGVEEQDFGQVAGAFVLAASAEANGAGMVSDELRRCPGADRLLQRHALHLYGACTPEGGQRKLFTTVLRDTLSTDSRDSVSLQEMDAYVKSADAAALAAIAVLADSSGLAAVCPWISPDTKSAIAGQHTDEKDRADIRKALMDTAEQVDREEGQEPFMADTLRLLAIAVYKKADYDLFMKCRKNARTSDARLLRAKVQADMAELGRLKEGGIPLGNLLEEVSAASGRVDKEISDFLYNTGRSNILYHKQKKGGRP